MPRHWEERLLRVYLKRDVDGDDRRKYTDAVKMAFRNYLRRVGLSEQVHSPVLTHFASRPGTSECGRMTSNIRKQLLELQPYLASPPEQTVASPTPTADTSDDLLSPLTKRARRAVR